MFVPIYSLINSTKPRSINHEINWTFLVVYCYGVFGIVRFCDMLFEIEVFKNMFCSSLEYNEKKLNKQSQKTYTFESKKTLYRRFNALYCVINKNASSGPSSSGLHVLTQFFAHVRLAIKFLLSLTQFVVSELRIIMTKCLKF